MLPPHNVLAAIDFSPGSRAALTFAIRLARHCAADLHVLHAVPASLVHAARLADHPPSPRCGYGAAGDIREEMLDELRRVLSECAPTAGAAAHCHVIEGDAATVILDIAAREQADVIVLGAKGLSNDAWPALGSTLEDVVRRTTIPIVAVPATWLPPDARADGLTGSGPIIAGVDMTCPAIEGAVAGCQIAGALGTEVVLLHAVPPPQTPGRWQVHANAAAAAALEQSKVDFERVASAIKARSTVPVTLHTECSDIATALARQALAHPGGIVVLGRGGRPHSYGPPGSIVARTLLLGRVPVLMYL